MADTAPPPREWVRLKHAAWLFFPTLVVVLALRLIWGSIASRRLNEQLAAAGNVPLTVEALYPHNSPISESDNAVPLLVQAMQSHDPNAYMPAESNLEYGYQFPLPPAWHQLADAAMSSPANLEALRLARVARGKSQFYWNFKVSKPLMRMLPTGQLNQARALANLLGDAALYAHVHGDDLEAMERLRDIHHLAASLHAQKLLISYLVATGIDALALHRLEVIAPGLKIPADESAPLRREVRAQITALLDDRSPADALSGAFTGERVFLMDQVAQTTEHVWMLRPMFDLDMARILKRHEDAIRAATQPTMPAASKILSSMEVRRVAFAGSSPRFSRSLTAQFTRSLERTVEIGMRMRLERKAAAISLAAQLYRADHGDWPGTLDALVPRYLPAIPVDSFSPDAKPLTYLLVARALPDGRDRPVVYSVGPDGVDTFKGKRSLPADAEYGWQGIPPTDDQYRDLSRWPAPATTQPSTP